MIVGSHVLIFTGGLRAALTLSGPLLNGVNISIRRGPPVSEIAGSGDWSIPIYGIMELIPKGDREWLTQASGLPLPACQNGP